MRMKCAERRAEAPPSSESRWPELLISSVPSSRCGPCVRAPQAAYLDASSTSRHFHPFTVHVKQPLGL